MAATGCSLLNDLRTWVKKAFCVNFTFSQRKISKWHFVREATTYHRHFMIRMIVPYIFNRIICAHYFFNLKMSNEFTSWEKADWIEKIWLKANDNNDNDNDIEIADMSTFNWNEQQQKCTFSLHCNRIRMYVGWITGVSVRLFLCSVLIHQEISLKWNVEWWWYCNAPYIFIRDSVVIN